MLRPDWETWQQPTSANPLIPAAELEAARRELGQTAYAQEFDASFVAHGGLRMHREWFRYTERVDAEIVEGYEPVVRPHWKIDDTLIPESSLRIEQFVDLAASVKTGADFTVIGTFGFTQEQPRRMIVLEVVRARMEGPDILRTMKERAARWNPSAIFVESVAFQLSMVQWARRDGLPVRELRADRDKIARALPLEARLEAGQVLFDRDGSWLNDLEVELTGFPHAAHDDQVDVLAYAAARMMETTDGFLAL